MRTSAARAAPDSVIYGTAKAVPLSKTLKFTIRPIVLDHSFQGFPNGVPIFIGERLASVPDAP